MKQNPSLTAVTFPTKVFCSPCCGGGPAGPAGVLAAYGHCEALWPISLQLWQRIDVTTVPASLLSPSPTCSVRSSHLGWPLGHAAHAKVSNQGPVSPRALVRMARATGQARITAKEQARASDLGPWGKSLPCSCHTALFARASFGTWGRACKIRARTCARRRARRRGCPWNPRAMRQ